MYTTSDAVNVASTAIVSHVVDADVAASQLGEVDVDVDKEGLNAKEDGVA